jgi:hypothetical protein
MLLTPRGRPDEGPTRANNSWPIDSPGAIRESPHARGLIRIFAPPGEELGEPADDDEHFDTPDWLRMCALRDPTSTATVQRPQ